LIYGANGYTGSLIAHEAARRGLSPTLAGRNEREVAGLAAELGLGHRIFGLADPPALAQGIAGHAVVVHCAGPFSRTARPMLDACIRYGIHYLNITGEEDVLESITRRGAESQAANVMVLPGAGFDVVPSDFLAARQPTGGHCPAVPRLRWSRAWQAAASFVGAAASCACRQPTGRGRLISARGQSRP
jgi:saccharopine dehydrogenase (NAD+, L-lysine-forming)